MLAAGVQVVGVDNVNDYYCTRLKRARLAELLESKHFRFIEMDLADRARASQLFETCRAPRVVHLAAQAGVRYSIDNPQAYIDSNLVGFANVLEGCRQNGVEHLVYASSSSVYGANVRVPFSEHHSTDHPVSLYAATKRAGELLAHSYSHLYALPVTGLRFFTVYGPWGRPDMALWKFTEAIAAGRPIDVYNHGQMRRDFTYVDDVVEGICRVIDLPAGPNPEWSAQLPDPATSNAPFRVYNIGNHEPVELEALITLLERAIGKPAIRRQLPMQPGDVLATFADTSDLQRDTGFRPRTPIAVGVRRFVDWFLDYHGMSPTGRCDHPAVNPS